MPMNLVDRMVHAPARGVISYAHVTRVSMVILAGIVSKRFIYLVVVAMYVPSSGT